MMEPVYTCKLCKKNFSNGRVLGGHMRAHLALHSAKEQPDVASKKPQETDSRHRVYGLRGNPKSSWKVRETQNLFAAFCPIKRKRTTRVFVTPPPSPILGPDESSSDWGRLPSTASLAVSDAEMDIDDEDHEAALTLLLLSRGRTDPHNQITKKSLIVAVPVLPVKVDKTTIHNVERYVKAGKRAHEEEEGSFGGSRRKMKLDHDFKVPKIKIKDGYGDCPIGDFNIRVRDGKENQPKLLCPVCFKHFKSVKAIHGHQRVHSTKEDTSESDSKTRLVAAVPRQFKVSGISSTLGLECYF